MMLVLGEKCRVFSGGMWSVAVLGVCAPAKWEKNAKNEKKTEEVKFCRLPPFPCKIWKPKFGACLTLPASPVAW